MLPQNIVVMKVGPHSGMSLEEIIQSKREEELVHGVHYWGYSGTMCQPRPAQRFCHECLQGNHEAPSIILIETKSAYQTDQIGLICAYSEDGINFLSFPGPVQLQGAKFAFVSKSLHIIDDFRLSDYIVVGGKNDGKPLPAHLRSRVGKAFAHLLQEPSEAQPSPPIRVLAAELCSPYAVWLKEEV